jgi:protease I
MATTLSGKKIALLATDGFEQSEFEQPLKTLRNEGAEVDIISLRKGMIKAWKEGNWGEEFVANIEIGEAKAQDYDALVLPGGVISPDKLRVNEEVVTFVKEFLESGKPLAAICHGPWTLIETGLLRGRTLTSYKSIRSDLLNAGANWVDEEVVVDQGLITSRSPKDLNVFCKKLVEKVSQEVKTEKVQSH